MFGCDQDQERLEQEDNINSEIYLKNNPNLKNAIMDFIFDSSKAKSCINQETFDLDSGYVMELEHRGTFLIVPTDSEESKEYNLFYYVNGKVVFYIDETHSVKSVKSSVSDCKDECYEDLQKQIKKVTKEYRPLRIVWAIVNPLLGEVSAQRACDYECRPR